MLRFVLKGQIPSGKNAVLITRSGRRYPAKRFSAWRAAVLPSIPSTFTYHVPMDVSVIYTPGDRRRRDTPGMIDALYHVMEKSGLVRDDAQFKNLSWVEMPVNRCSPNVEISISPCTAQYCSQ